MRASETLGGNGYTSAYRVNELGVICGYSEVPTGGSHAVIWGRDGLRADDPLRASVQINDVLFINNRGRSWRRAPTPATIC